MGIQKVVRCDGSGCNAVIEPNTGFVVLGNIHKVGSAEQKIQSFDCVGGGLVGNNLEDREVQRACYYCDTCMLRILGQNVSKPITRKL